MKKIILCLLIIASSVSAFELDRGTIAIQAKIYPQIIFFSQKAKEYNAQKPIVIAAVYGEGGKKFADIFKDEIEKQYPDGIKGVKITVKTVARDKLAKDKDVSASYVIFDDDDNTKLNYVDEMKSSITFAATKRAFMRNGAMFYVEITNKTSILLNKKTLLNSKVSFDPSLLKIVKVYDE
jgi:hypothetical protein